MTKEWSKCEEDPEQLGDDDGGRESGEEEEGEEDGDKGGEPDRKKRKSKACCHGPDAPGCNRYNWTALNKGEWELQLWQDSKMIISYGNFFSATRAGYLARGRHGAKKSYRVWAPEGTWHYNVEGRSPTDNHDAARKKIAIAERRICRQGTKGMAFVFDLAFTNGSIVHDFLKPAGLKGKAKKAYTKA